jgi:hypothetical protein
MALRNMITFLAEQNPPRSTAAASWPLTRF